MKEKVTIWNKKILFLGDSITHNGLYISYLDAFFLRHFHELRPELINLGVSSETACGLSEPDHPWPRPNIHNRVKKALAEIKPDIVVICYGMNDGIYYPLSNKRFEEYKRGISELISTVETTDADIVVMTPPIFDAKSAQVKRLLPENMEKYSYMEPYEDYNEVLRYYSGWIKSLDKKVDKVLDIFTPMNEDLLQQRIRNDKYVSGDGIHPNQHGHWIIARTFLKGVLNITLEREPAYINNDKMPEWFKMVLEKNQLLSDSWREYIGHDNPNKAPSLPVQEAQRIYRDLENRITELLSNIDTEKQIDKSVWKGYIRYDFYYKGREGILVVPDKPAEAKPWVWRAEFFDAFSQADMSLLEKGWYLVFYRISDMYGSPEAVELMHDFHEYVVKKFLLNEQTVIFGFSRGGLYSVNYSAAFPEKVSALYLDAPVLDIKSWPGGKGKGSGAASEWRECLEIYNLTEEDAVRYSGNPVDKAQVVAQYGIPVIIVAGDSDKVVPYEENGKIFAEKYKEAGGVVKVILKPGVDHHPHSLEDPQPIVDFLLTQHI